MISECGCADPYYPKYGKAFDYVNVSSCDASNIVEGKELSRLYNIALCDKIQLFQLVIAKCVHGDQL